jgi:ABC-type uncharacterized transport system auxiliary subunit
VTDRLRRVRLAAAALALAALGCAGSPLPPDSFHRLVVPAPAASGARLPGVVEVDRLQASDALRGRPLARADAEGRRLRLADYDHWVDAPTSLLQRALVEHLRAGGVADEVVTPEQRADADWLVSGRIDRFEWVEGGAGAVRVELSLRAHGDRAPRVHGTYEATRRAASDDARAAAAALGEATGAVFDAFLRDVAAVAPGG